MESITPIKVGALFSEPTERTHLWRVEDVFLDDRGITNLKVRKEEGSPYEGKARLFTHDEFIGLLDDRLVRENTEAEAEEWREEEHDLTEEHDVVIGRP